MQPKKRSALGKGLEGMIQSSETKKATTKSKDSKKEVNANGEVLLNINEVEPNREQPRKEFREDKLEELSDSIKQRGVLEPLIVAKKEDYYEIICGERRWRASKMAGLKEVPVVIKDYSPQEIMEVALIENIQREDLNPVEEAKAYQRLIDEYDLKQEEVAKKVSKSRTAVTNSLRLLKLDENVLFMLQNEELTNGHARALLGIDDKEKQIETAKKIVKEGLNVRETEKLVKNVNNPTKKPVKTKLKNEAIYRDIEEKLKQKLNTKVKISRKSEKQGKIEIEYFSQEELEEILKHIK